MGLIYSAAHGIILYIDIFIFYLLICLFFIFMVGVITEWFLPSQYMPCKCKCNAERGEIALAPPRFITGITREDDFLLKTSDVLKVTIRSYNFFMLYTIKFVCYCYY